MKKRILACLLALVMIIGILPVMALAEDAAITPDYSWYTGGATEFTIATPAQLLGFANIVNGLDGQTKDTFRNKKVTLSDDINLATIENWTPIGRLDASDNFEGEFDGNGKTISNMKITFATGRVRAGLFASPESALIHDLTLKNFTIKAEENTTNDNVRAGALAANI